MANGNKAKDLVIGYQSPAVCACLIDEQSSLVPQLSRHKAFVIPSDQMIKSFPARAPRIATKLRIVEVMKLITDN